MSTPVGDFWKTSVDELRAKLLLGSAGRLHLTDCLSAGFSESPEAQAARIDMAVTAFAEDPLEGSAAHLLAQSGPVVPEPLRDMARAVVARILPPDNLTYFQRLAARRDYPKLRNFLEGRMKAEPDNLFWRRQALAFSVFEDDREWSGELTAMDLPSPLEPLAEKMRGDAALLSNDPGKAEAHYRAMGNVLGPGFLSLRLSAALMEQENREHAMNEQARCLIASPWRTNIALRLHDLITEQDRETAPLQGGTTIFLYTFNKCRELDETLASLHRADLGDAVIHALDNGSSDHTSEVLTKWVDRFSPDRLHRIDLPVNIGAPAARNWLKQLPEAANSDWMIYLDDDAEVPADFLGRFGAAVQRYPDAGAWGCKVTDHAAPRRIQSADLHLMRPRGLSEIPEKPDITRPEPNPFRVTDLHIQELDLGQFDYMRPCTSVTGCCHLFSAATLREVGDFSIALSPSQYDDMEHDIKTALAGKTAVYTGHLHIRHKKRSGNATLTGAPEQGNALGNKFKMQTMHDPAAISEIMHNNTRRLHSDLLEKLETVEQYLKETLSD